MEVQTEIKRWGNSLALRVSGLMAEIPGFTEGMRVAVEVTEEGLMVRPIPSEVREGALPYSERELLSGLDAVRATNEQDDIAGWLDLAARLCLDLGEHERALEYSSEAMELLGSVPIIVEPEGKLYSHARALLAAGQEAQAVEYLQSAYDRVMLVADNTQDETLRQSWLEKRTNREILDLYRQKVAGG